MIKYDYGIVEFAGFPFDNIARTQVKPELFSDKFWTLEAEILTKMLTHRLMKGAHKSAQIGSSLQREGGLGRRQTMRLSI